MAKSVCYQCPDRQVPKTCEATCQRRQKELKVLEEERHRRCLDGIENDSVRTKTYRRKQYRQMKDGRRR